MSRTINSIVDKETVSIEAYSGIDGQGAPSYGSVSTSEAHVRFTSAFVVEGDGSRTPTPCVLYFAPDADAVPGEKDRVTVGSDTFIAREVKPVRPLRKSRAGANLDHTKVKCMRESTG